MNERPELAIHLFHEGTARRAYELLGAHPYEDDGRRGFVFRVFAPHAARVFVVGDFNGWQCERPMDKLSDGGLYETYIEGATEFQSYKYEIETDDGRTLYKSDPYGFHAKTRPDTDSKLFCLDKYQWQDNAWKRQSMYDKPMNVYEVHLGSWRRYADGNFFNYRKIAEELIPYVKDMGFTHIELLPIAEYPFDGSWGYQVIGYFAPTSRYGTPDDFMYLVDLAHQNGIGVILDWVPGHFPKDACGLYMFDGEPCYEYADPLKAEHKEWGTMVFDWGSTHVQSFLISNAFFWIDKYHVDGLRVDAVASMLYLDYARKEGEWQPNSQGGRENLEAAAFLKKLNSSILTEYPDIMMIAEESTAWPMVTMPPHMGGLGFNFKWNMGFMNDTLEYMKTDPYFRQYKHHNLTFSMQYAFSENYILPLSHDEVVHMKGSLITKMPGSYEQKFENLKTYLGYMWTHPGKKLMFMGGELAQFNEWHYESELDWNLLDYPMHRAYKRFVKDLNSFYLERSELWEIEDSWDGFQWIEANDFGNNVITFRRKNRAGKELLIACNFSADDRPAYRFGVPHRGPFKVIFQSNLEIYGGHGEPIRNLRVDKHPESGEEYSMCLRLPALTFVVFLGTSDEQE